MKIASTPVVIITNHHSFQSIYNCSSSRTQRAYANTLEPSTILNHPPDYKKPEPSTISLPDTIIDHITAVY